MPYVTGVYQGGIDRERDEKLMAAIEKMGGECTGSGCMLSGSNERDLEFKSADDASAEQIRAYLVTEGLTNVEVFPSDEPALH